MPAMVIPPSSARVALDRLKLERLHALLRAILPANSLYAAKLARVKRPLPESLEELADWPCTFKDELVAAAAATGRPANLTFPLDRYCRFHQTSGTHGRPLPIFDTAADWQWWMECWRLVLERGNVGEIAFWSPRPLAPTSGFGAALKGRWPVGRWRFPLAVCRRWPGWNWPAVWGPPC